MRKLGATKAINFRGHTFFKDISKGTRKFLRRRKHIFEGSVQHFMRGLWPENSVEEQFTITGAYDASARNNPFEISVATPGESKRVTIPEKEINVVFENDPRYRSTVSLLDESYFFVDRYGDYHPHEQVVISGHMASYRLGHMLPLNYENVRF